ncbi:MAG: hypothetical protein HKN22_03345 [Bacteroidia bacterium]|nr:hypothetical protein [Bacteroidia bacterium]
MCTVSFLPLSNSGFILTSSRDEAFDRASASFPFTKSIALHQEVVYPLDPQGTGTWVASSKNSTVCLLNGAQVKHKHRPPYRHSRGLVVTGFYEYENAKDFYENFDLHDIEPFTLLMLEHQNKDLVFNELLWDGNEKVIRSVDTSNPNIWSSVTLYTDEVISERRSWFKDWLKENKNYDVEKIRNFHHFGGSGNDEISIKMKRGSKLGSLSITSILKSNTDQAMYYEDLEKDDLTTYKFSDSINVINK